MQMNPEQALVGLSTEPRSISYTWRDAALYALAVGAGPDDLEYTYEKYLKAIPTFGTTPMWEAIHTRPRLERPKPAAVFAEEVVYPTIAPLHMEHEVVFHRPIDPIRGTFIFRDVVTDVYDRGEGKGAVVRARLDVHDEAGNLVCSNFSNTLFQQAGGFGGKPMPKNPVQIPDRAPDIAVRDQISPVQNVLFRLTGDTNLVHVDPEIARERGFDRVFMQGLCSFGFACRMGIGALIPGQSERLSRISAQMRSILYPGTPITLQIWKTDENEAVFRLLDERTLGAVLDKGVLAWK